MKQSIEICQKTEFTSTAKVPGEMSRNVSSKKLFQSQQPAATYIAVPGMETLLVGELPPVFIIDCEVTSGSAVSSASLTGDGNRVAH